MLTFDAAPKARQDEGMRKPRFKRVKPTSALQLREGGYQVLELLHQFKALRSHHIAMHLPHRHERGLLHSLRNLFDHGLIDKVNELRRFNALYQHDTYTLSQKGRDALAGRDLPPCFVPSHGALGFRLNHEWDHSMMIIDLISNLVAGARERGVRPISAEEIARQSTTTAPFIFPRKSVYTDRKTGRVVPYTVVPDGLIGFQYPSGKSTFFAVEAEHNKPNSRTDDDDPKSSQTSTRKKFMQYRDIDWRRVYGNLGIKNMRVLVVAPTPTQIENKFVVGRSVVKESHLFLGHWLPIVSGDDVPTLPQIFDAPWLRIGLPPEQINATTLRAG
ncbi:MAG: replication-relaxation family protein [Pseudomonadota bacterium]